MLWILNPCTQVLCTRRRFKTRLLTRHCRVELTAAMFRGVSKLQHRAALGRQLFDGRRLSQLAASRGFSSEPGAESHVFGLTNDQLNFQTVAQVSTYLPPMDNSARLPVISHTRLLTADSSIYRSFYLTKLTQKVRFNTSSRSLHRKCDPLF